MDKYTLITKDEEELGERVQMLKGKRVIVSPFFFTKEDLNTLNPTSHVILSESLSSEEKESITEMIRNVCSNEHNIVYASSLSMKMHLHK